MIWVKTEHLSSLQLFSTNNSFLQTVFGDTWQHRVSCREPLSHLPHAFLCHVLAHSNHSLETHEVVWVWPVKSFLQSMSFLGCSEWVIWEIASAEIPVSMGHCIHQSLLVSYFLFLSCPEECSLVLIISSYIWSSLTWDQWLVMVHPESDIGNRAILICTHNKLWPRVRPTCALQEKEEKATFR